MARSEVLELDVRLEPRDFLRANYALLFSTHLMRGLLFLAAILLLLSAYSWATDSQPMLRWGLILPGFVLLLSVNVLIAMVLSFSSNKALKEQFHYSFSDAGISASSSRTRPIMTVGTIN